MKSLIKIFIATMLVSFSANLFAQTQKTQAQIQAFIDDSLVVDGVIQTSKFITLIQDVVASSLNSADTASLSDHVYLKAEDDSMNTLIRNSAFESAFLRTDLLTYWALINTTDTVGGNTITNNVGTVFSSNGATFDGGSNRLESALSNPPTDSIYSIAFEIKLDSLPSEVGDDFYVTFGYTTGSTVCWKLYVTSADKVQIINYNTSNTSHTTRTTNTLSKNNAYTVTITNSASGDNAQIYIDGVEATYDLQPAFAGTPRISNVEITLGADTFGNKAMYGTIKNFRYWERKLSLDEIQMISKIFKYYPLIAPLQ